MSSVALRDLTKQYAGNTALTGQWQIAGLPVDPGRFTKPALVVVPAKDKLVPPVSALALAERLPRAEVLQPDLGHIGLLVGSKAPEAVWRPVREWLLQG